MTGGFYEYAEHFCSQKYSYDQRRHYFDEKMETAKIYDYFILAEFSKEVANLCLGILLKSF